MNGIHLEPYKFSKIHFLLWILSTYSTSQKGINKQLYRISTKPTLNFTDWSFPWTVDTSDIFFFFPARRNDATNLTEVLPLVQLAGDSSSQTPRIFPWHDTCWRYTLRQLAKKSTWTHENIVSLLSMRRVIFRDSTFCYWTNKQILTKPVNKISAQFPLHLVLKTKKQKNTKKNLAIK